MKLDKVGSIGLVSDIDPFSLPPEAITAGINFRCKHDYITPCGGYEQHKDLTGTGSAYYLVPVQTGTDYYWVFPVDTDADGECEAIYSWNGTSLVNLTNSGGAYTGSGQWNGCNLHGVVILNNGSEPQVIDNPANANDATNLIYDGVTDWETQVYKAAVIRSHKNFLWALDITDNTTRYPTMVHWSSPALPGAAPTSWDYTDAAEQSNRRTLSETPGTVIDGLSLRDDFIIYKDDSVYVATLTGEPTYVYRTRLLFRDRGIYSIDCACDIGGRHFVVGDGKVYIHDGNTATDILYGRNADDLFQSIDSDNYSKVFVFHNRPANEVWICYPSEGQGSIPVCDSVYVYNYLQNTWAKREIPNIHHALTGLVVETSNTDTWDYETSMTWDSETDLTWVYQQYSPIGDAILGAGASLWQMDTGLKFNGSDPEVYVQRSGLSIGGVGQWHQVSTVYPIAGGSRAFTLQIGTQKKYGGAITWSQEKTVTPGTTRKVSFRANGPIHAWKITGAGDWKFYGFEYDAIQSGSGR